MTTSRYTRAREMAGLSIGQAVKLLGWRVPALLTDIESGEHSPTDEVYRKLADLYGVSAAWLVGSDPIVPRSAERVIRQAARDERISSSCAEEMLELFGAIYTPESRR